MFREKATTQLAAYLINKAGGTIEYLVLIKMLYDADRTMLLECGRPITFDRWVSMERGPVLSATYDLLKPTAPKSYWSEHIKTDRYNVAVISDPGDSDLSDKAIELADRAFEHFKGCDYKEATKRAHDLFAEWTDPGASQFPISYEDVLLVNGRLDSEHLSELKENLELSEFFSKLTA